MDGASRLACNRMQSCGECIGLRHLVSSANRNVLECFMVDDFWFMVYVYEEQKRAKLTSLGDTGDYWER